MIHKVRLSRNWYKKAFVLIVFFQILLLVFRIIALAPNSSLTWNLNRTIGWGWSTIEVIDFTSSFISIVAILSVLLGRKIIINDFIFIILILQFILQIVEFLYTGRFVFILEELILPFTIILIIYIVFSISQSLYYNFIKNN